MRNADGPTGATKEDVQQITDTDLSGDDLGPEQDEIHGNGADGQIGAGA